MTYDHPMCPPPRGADLNLTIDIPRIIAEDDTHVAVVVRLPKAAIMRSLPFLAALADLTPPADSPPALRAAAS